MIEDLKERHQIMLVCDLHGHTKKRNVFIYGCSLKSPEILDKERNLLARVIPYQLSKKNPFFSFVDSHFRIEKSKDSTARIVLFQELEITHSYTMEASFFGPSNSESFGYKFNGDMHMKPEDLETLGQDLCRCCQSFNSQKIYSRKIYQTNNYLKTIRIKSDENEEIIEDDIPEEDIGVIVKEKLCDDIEVVDVGVDPESSGSDSEPSDSESTNSAPQRKTPKIIENPIQVEPTLSRTPATVIKQLAVKKPKSLEPEWSLRRTVRSPMVTNLKAQEIVPQQNFNFPLQSKFNPFSLDIKLKSEIPELEIQKKFTPKITNSPRKPPVIPTKQKNTELYLPALLNVNLPDAKVLFSRSTRRQQHSEVFNDSIPREVFHIGSSSFNGNL